MRMLVRAHPGQLGCNCDNCDYSCRRRVRRDRRLTSAEETRHRLALLKQMLETNQEEAKQ